MIFRESIGVTPGVALFACGHFETKARKYLIDEKSIENSFSHTLYPGKVAAMQALEEILKKCVLLDDDNNGDATP